MKYLVIGLATSALISPSAAFAQSSDQSAGIEEIIVTAQRREQSVIDVPQSITAISGDNLASSGVQTISDLKFQTPGFIAQAGTGYTQLYIRGIGNSIYVGADPSVATFIDDVPRTYGSLVDNFINVERVEVLKGAQGGLYGRNATGGVVNIITRQPGDDPAMNARITYGDYDTVEAAAYVNIPLGETMAVNFSAARRIHDPYVKNLARPNPYPAGTTSFFGDPNAPIEVGKLNHTDFYALDGKFRINLSDTFKVTIAGDYNLNDGTQGNGWRQLDPEGNYQAYLGFAAAAGISNPLPRWPQARKRETYGSILNFSRTEDYGASAKIEWNLDGLDLTSITALRWNNSNYRGDLGAAPVPMAGFETDFNRNSLYQELRFVSTGEGPLRFLGGASYFEDDVESRVDGLFIGFLASTTLSTTKTKNYSVYGELSYDLTDALTLTGSLRWIKERKTGFFPAQAIFPAESLAIEESKVLPSATISYDLGNGVAYGRYARGFKTGGINPIVVPAAFQGQPGDTFRGETVDTFEVGYRTQIFDNRVQLTTAIFYNDYKALQVVRAGNAANPLVANAILNAGTARTYGAEAAVTWRIIPELTVSANVGYLNARYKRAAYAGSPIVDPFDASGNRMLLAPKWQGGASADLDVPVDGSFRLKANALYSYVGSFNHQYEEDPLLQQKGYSIVNLRAGVATIDDHLGFYIFANNLFDKVYTVFGTQNTVAHLTVEGAPRVVGATLEVKF